MTTITIEGEVMLTGSKRGERYVEVAIASPYNHVAQLTVNATEDQDDDALTEAIRPALNAGRARITANLTAHGDLECTSDGLVAA